MSRLDSQFSGAYFTGYAGVGSQVALHGTERSKPTLAIDSTTQTPTVTGQYIRIGNDIWVNTGNPDALYHYNATDAAAWAVIAQYEPYALATHIAQAQDCSSNTNRSALRRSTASSPRTYALSQADRDALIQESGLDPEVWAGDVWIATNGGYLVSLRWVPRCTAKPSPARGSFGTRSGSPPLALLVKPPAPAAAGIGHVRWHDLRHAHATLMLAPGVHPKIVSERLGHASVGITLDLYSHVLPGLQEAAAAKLDALLADPAAVPNGR